MTTTTLTVRQPRNRPGIDPLCALGFSELEAAAYVYLVEHSPATPYGVAQGIGRPVANTYKAVESLRNKGAVLVDGRGGSRECRAVPPKELLQSLGSAFEQRRTAAAESLARLKPVSADSGVFALTTIEQVNERCVRMLKAARHVVIADLFPGPLNALRSHLEAAAARGVSVSIQAYAPATIAGATTLVRREAKRVRKRWPGDWMVVVVDGAEYILAYIDAESESVQQAQWSQSALFAWAQHSYLYDVIRANTVDRILAEGGSADDCRMALASARRQMTVKPPVAGRRRKRD